ECRRAACSIPSIECRPDCSALAQLPELHRVALTLRYFEELDYGTIEQTLGLTNGALRGILGRALGLMRKRLKPALTSIG
ncbi:MAG: hypothetical protein M3N48_08920, partial [Verrucomicrobiota bacterium]|nr:hypothetical protein [Verrucomicrobiota bacterium]